MRLALLFVVLLPGGCSFFASAPSANWQPVPGAPPPVCAPGAAAVADGVVFGAALVTAIVAVNSCDDSAFPGCLPAYLFVAAPATVVAIPSALGALVGVEKVGRCRAAKRAWRSMREGKGEPVAAGSMAATGMYTRITDDTLLP